MRAGQNSQAASSRWGKGKAGETKDSEEVLLMRLLMALLLVIATGPARAEADWRLERENDGISVWTRAVEGSNHRAVRARMVVDTPIMELVALIRDTQACPEWAEFCAASHVHESVSEAEAYIYTLNDMPCRSRTATPCPTSCGPQTPPPAQCAWMPSLPAGASSRSRAPYALPKRQRAGHSPRPRAACWSVKPTSTRPARSPHGSRTGCSWMRP